MSTGINQTHCFFESEMPSIVPEIRQVLNTRLLFALEGNTFHLKKKQFLRVRVASRPAVSFLSLGVL